MLTPDINYAQQYRGLIEFARKSFTRRDKSLVSADGVLAKIQILPTHFDVSMYLLHIGYTYILYIVRIAVIRYRTKGPVQQPVVYMFTF